MPAAPTEYTALASIELSTGIRRRGDVITVDELAEAGQDEVCIANLVADEALVEGIVEIVVEVTAGDGAVAGDAPA